MADIVIKAENLGKKYIIGHQAEIGGGYLAFRDVLVQHLNNFWHKTKDLVRGKPIIQGTTQEEFWALRDVSFEIQRGETIGIIGRNGAGKSTLLKILSRITEPSTGRVTIKGRVSSLLEVGTGFHPELTGRENIYLNGAILGMTRAEVKRKFDEIVDFSGVEQFLDTPVKRFSSDMYVRLAFAVAAHLEPEILVVDEVLAVGDAEFQKKCLGKMGEVAGEGRTVLFVSHNMGAIESLCQKTILLVDGEIDARGKSKDIVNLYLSSSNNESVTPISERKDRRGSGKLFFKNIKINTDRIRDKELDIILLIENRSEQTFGNILISVVINDPLGNPISNLVNVIINKQIYVGLNSTDVKISIFNLNLVPGIYSISPFISSDRHNGEIFDWVFNAAEFEVPDYDYYDIGSPPYVKGQTVYLDYNYENL